MLGNGCPLRLRRTQPCIHSHFSLGNLGTCVRLPSYRPVGSYMCAFLSTKFGNLLKEHQETRNMERCRTIYNVFIVFKKVGEVRLCVCLLTYFFTFFFILKTRINKNIYLQNVEFKVKADRMKWSL